MSVCGNDSVDASDFGCILVIGVMDYGLKGGAIRQKYARYTFSPSIICAWKIAHLLLLDHLHDKWVKVDQVPLHVTSKKVVESTIRLIVSWNNSDKVSRHVLNVCPTHLFGACELCG